jgi:hypothetical protein
MDAIAEHSPLRRRWLQFSLRGMLLLTVLAAVGFSLWTSYRQQEENRRLKTEVKQLNAELGKIHIEAGEEHKLHAVVVPTFDEHNWRWRVYIPPQ